MNTKKTQIETSMARVLSRAIHDLQDPRLPLVVTVEGVRVTPDLLYAKVFVSSLGDNTQVLEVLGHAKGHLQHEIAVELRLRRTPQLSFHDASNVMF